MICLKTREEIELIRESCLLVSKTLARVARIIQPGITTSELDKEAEAFIKNNGGYPAFLNYRGFPNTLCISVNDTVVHGIPSNYKIKDGDLVSVDCGVEKNGFFGDSCFTFLVGDVSNEKTELSKITFNALQAGIELAIEGNFIGAIGNAVHSYVEKRGYSVVRELAGHGIGRKLHEEPDVPNFGKQYRGNKMVAGMVLAIEPMINAGTRRIYQLNDGWTIKTFDRRPSAHFEHTIAVGFERAEILSTFDFIIEEVQKNKFLWQNRLQ
ncbi:MAG: type I methionyl aminopeptidase [Prolixibacteraceae bacterium]|nr:type I methionyl aminopeptidase [Prolixibacteraceae bacterium]MBN2774242.1 type I methionyl aminopeptidase [Prolixibacteraceae bacterium]